MILGGRHQAALTDREIERAANTFHGLDPEVNVRYEEGARTIFHVVRDGAEEYGEIVFGSDIYPGQCVVDPNSTLNYKAAAAHELTHFHRWINMRALDYTTMPLLDEALTSLEAILRYERHLTQPDIRELVSEAIQRLQLYARELADQRPAQ